MDILSRDDKAKRFMSCFICGVEVHEDYVMVTDSSERHEFYIDKEDKEAMKSFALWFKEVYLKCIPQTLAVISYSIVQKNEDESIRLVHKIHSAAVEMQQARSAGDESREETSQEK